MRIVSTSSSTKSAPQAPTIGTATDVGTNRSYISGAATVSFTAPTFDGKLPITTYTVTSSPAGGATNTGSSSPITVTNLNSNTNYTFTVTATNAVGTSVASSATSSILVTTVPQSVTIGTATAGNAQATVAFTPRNTGGKTITSYTATSSPGGFTGSAASSPITVTGLTNGTAYTFTVTATNANGTSLASAASGSVTPAAATAFDSIATVTAAGGETSLTFSSIPQTYKHLQVRWVNQMNVAGATGIWFRPNNDSGASYAYHQLLGNGATASTSANASSSIGMIAASFGYNANYKNVGTFDLLDYANTSKYKTGRAFSGFDDNSGTNTATVRLCSSLWMSTAAVSSLVVYMNTDAFMAGSTFALYGIK